MSLNHLTTVNDYAKDSLNIGANKIKTPELVLENQDGTTTTLNLPNQGTDGYALHTDGAGSTYWAPDDQAAAGMVYTGTTPAVLGTHYKINDTNGQSAVESKLVESASELDAGNLRVVNASDPVNNQDLVTKNWVVNNPSNPFDQDLNTTDPAIFTNELVVQNGVNSDNFYFKDEETKCNILHKISGTRYNIVEGTNSGEISIGDIGTASLGDINLVSDFVNTGSIIPDNATRSVGQIGNPFQFMICNQLDLRTLGGSSPIITLNGTYGSTKQILQIIGGNINWSRIPYDIVTACSDETTPLTLGTNLTTFRIFKNIFITRVYASLTTAQPSGSLLTIDVKRNGTTIFGTNKITFDNTEKSSYTATTQPNLTTVTANRDDEFTVDITQIGTSGATGLKIYIIAEDFF